MSGRTCIILMLLVPYVICGVLVCLLVRDRVACNGHHYYPYFLVGNNVTLPEPMKIFEERFCAGDYHGVRCLVGTMWVGFAMLTFRLLPGKNTKVIKYVHATLHVVTIGIFSYDIYKMYTLDRSITHTTYYFHAWSSQVALGALYFQFLVAGLVYIYLVENCTLRCIFAPIHDIIGIWIYICLVACCLSGHFKARVDYVAGIHPKTILITICGFPIILLIVVSPLFEWEMVGTF